MPPAVEARSLHHWTTREVPQQAFRTDDATPANRLLATAWGPAVPGLAQLGPLLLSSLGALTVEPKNVGISTSFLPELTQGNFCKAQITYPETRELNLEQEATPAFEQSRQA